MTYSQSLNTTTSDIVWQLTMIHQNIEKLFFIFKPDLLGQRRQNQWRLFRQRCVILRHDRRTTVVDFELDPRQQSRKVNSESILVERRVQSLHETRVFFRVTVTNETYNTVIRSSLLYSSSSTHARVRQ